MNNQARGGRNSNRRWAGILIVADHSSIAQVVQSFGESRVTAWLLRIPLPSRAEHLHGLDFQMADTERLQSTYLFGQTHLGGWWFWYPVASIIKVPLPALGLFILAIALLPATFRGGDPIIWASLCVLLPAVETAFVISYTTGTGTNAAFRYMIPCIPLMCVWFGSVLCFRAMTLRCTVGCVLVWLLINAINGIPDHLGWQNEFGQAWSCWRDQPPLIGDSLDWGQDLARLSAWISRHAGRGSTLLCVYGLGTGEPYGLGQPASDSDVMPDRPPRYIAVSENQLFGYEPGVTIAIREHRWALGSRHRELLLELKPIARVGRTIRIYRRSNCS